MSNSNSQIRTRRNKAEKHRQKLNVIIRVLIVMLAVAIVVFVSLTAIQAKNRAQERDNSLNLSYDQVSDKEKNDYSVNNGAKPRLITIGKIGVKARAQEIGLLAANSRNQQQMDVPKNVHDVGWYNCQDNVEDDSRCSDFISPNGIYNETSAVIDGHSCSDKGCVFDKLSDLGEGDEIKIELGNNSTVTYLVDQVETLDLADVDMTKVMTPMHDDRAGLALITCEGSWSTRDSRGVRSMDKRVIVYASAK